jgi:hypothetical protein
MSNMDKLASQVPAVLAEASAHLRKTASRLVEVETENTALRHELRITKLAQRMEARGLEQTLNLGQKMAHLKEVDPTKLDALEHAVELSAGGFKLGSLEEPSGDNSVEDVQSELGSAAHHEALDTFILSGRALG